MPLPLAGGTPEEVPELEEGGVSDGDTRLNGAGCPCGAQAEARRISRQRARVGFIYCSFWLQLFARYTEHGHFLRFFLTAKSAKKTPLS